MLWECAAEEKGWIGFPCDRNRAHLCLTRPGLLPVPGANTLSFHQSRLRGFIYRRPYLHTHTHTHTLSPSLSLTHTNYKSPSDAYSLDFKHTILFCQRPNKMRSPPVHNSDNFKLSDWSQRAVWNDIMILVLKVRNTKSHWSTKWLPLEQSGCCKFEEHDRPPRGTISLVCMIFSKKVTVHTYIKLSIYYRILQILQIQQTCWRVGRYYSIIRLNGGIKTSAEIIFMRLSDK